MHRVDTPELMDTEPLPPATMARALGFLSMTNRWFGGASAVIGHLERWSSGWDPGREITILDAGCGAADIPSAAAHWARRRGFRVHITGVELVPEAAGEARRRTAGEPSIEIVEGDAFARLRDGPPVDYVTASLLLHHLPSDRHVDALRAFDAGARRGIVVSDLERSTVALAEVWLLSRVAGNRIVRHDGPLSVRRGFTIPELGELARAAGLPYLRAARGRWCRVILAGEKSP